MDRIESVMDAVMFKVQELERKLVRSDIGGSAYTVQWDKVRTGAAAEIMALAKLDEARGEAQELVENPPDVAALMTCVDALKGVNGEIRQRIIGSLIAFFPWRQINWDVKIADMWVQRQTPDKGSPEKEDGADQDCNFTQPG